MRLISPNVELLENTNNIDHAIKCAQVCYASQKDVENKEHWLASKWIAGHKSIFRHQTFYFAIPLIEVTNIFYSYITNNPYIGKYRNDTYLFLSVNGQTMKEVPMFYYLFKYSCNELTLKRFVQNLEDEEGITKILRRTVIVTTQVSTSRELNRTSPNNISEQSTRYCNFNSSKFGGHITFCEPHWSDLTTYYDKNNHYEEVKSNERIFFKGEDNKTIFATVGNANIAIKQLYPLSTKGIPQADKSSICYSETFAEDWLRTCLDAEERYFEAIKNGVKPEDARGLLPLDVATKVVYTYRIEEWDHIIDLRYYGKFGKPHPNAKIIATKIAECINNSLTNPSHYEL